MVEEELYENREAIEAFLAALADAAPRILGHLDRAIAEAEEAVKFLNGGMAR